MKRLTFLSILFFFSQLVQATPSKIDSLLHLLQEAGEDTTKVNLLNHISWWYYRNEPKRTVEFATRALGLAEELAYEKGICYAYNRLGIGYLMEGEKKKALEYFELAIESAEEIDDYKTLTGALNNIGMVHHENGEFELAFDYYQKAARLADTHNDLKNSCSYLNNLGVLLNEYGWYDRAITYYEKALIAAEKMNYDLATGTILMNIGAALNKKGKPEEGLEYYQRALSLKKKIGDKIGISSLLSNIGSLYAEQNLYETALDYEVEAYQLATSIEYKNGIILALSEIASIFQNLGQSEKAIHFGNLAIEQYKGVEELEGMPFLYETLAKSYADIGDYYKAYHYQIKFKTTNDSLFNDRKSQQINDLEIKYDTQQKEAENQLLRAQQAKNEALIKQRTSSSMAVSLFLLMVSIVTFFLYKANRQKNANNILLKNRVAERTRELENSNKELKKSNEELERFAYIASHDLKEPLRNIAGFIKLLERQLGDKLDDRSRDYITFVANNARQMHALIEDVLEFSKIKNIDIVFDRLDLNRIITQIRSALNATIQEREIIIQCDELPQVTSHYTQVFLLCKNLIENGIKYNQSTPPVIHISAKDTPDSFHIKIQDNGIGIEPEYQEKIFDMFTRLHDREKYQGSGMGLAICKKIIHRLGGDLWVESTPGQGSTFIFSLPKKVEHKLKPPVPVT